MKHLFAIYTLVLMCLLPSVTNAQESNTINDQVVRQKEIENGGTGRYRAIIVSEQSLPDFTIYRPRNIQYAARREGALPILIWCNGACSGSSIGYERMLNEIASHGYVVVGIGSFEMVDSERDDGGSNEKMVVDAINWLVRQEKLKSSDYYKAIDVKNIALSGHSCGGAQAIANCANTRVKTLLIMNAGMGGMSMGGASPNTLNSLHCPLIYMTGGPDDVAYGNAQTDFGKVKVKVAWADLSNAGHGGTYGAAHGGEFGRIAIKWMDWHLKGMKQNARLFLKPDLTGFSRNWSINTRNFTTRDMKYDEPFEAIETVTDTVFNRAAHEDSFDFGADVSSLTIETNSGRVFYNSEGQRKTLIPILKEKGINSLRLRVLVNPSDNNYTSSYAKSIANTARTQQLNVMLDLHYCDWWGDNVTPNAWSSYTLERLVTAVKSHTTAVVRTMNLTQRLKWVQIGNEVDQGMLWNTGRNMDNFVQFVNTAHEVIKEINPEVQTVIHISECEDTQWMTDYFDTLQAKGAQWDAIGLSVHVKGTTLTPSRLTDKVIENVKVLKERYGKPVLIVETGYYNDRELEANQWLCDLLTKLIDAGAAGLYYWEPELTEDFHLGAWNPRTRRPSIALDAFMGLRHHEGTYDAIHELQSGTEEATTHTEYFTPDGIRISQPQRGITIVRQHVGNHVQTYKMYVR
jgi:arabinogalactan endo-1,4-beta-galactosidase